MNKNGWSLSKINKYHSGRRWRFRSKPGRRLADILHKQRTDVNEVEMKEEDFSPEGEDDNLSDREVEKSAGVIDVRQFFANHKSN